MTCPVEEYDPGYDSDQKGGFVTTIYAMENDRSEMDPNNMFPKSIIHDDELNITYIVMHKTCIMKMTHNPYHVSLLVNMSGMDLQSLSMVPQVCRTNEKYMIACSETQIYIVSLSGEFKLIPCPIGIFTSLSSGTFDNGDGINGVPRFIVADYMQHCLYSLDIVTNEIKVICGTWYFNGSSDGQALHGASFNRPISVSYDSKSNSVFISEYCKTGIRILSLETLLVHTIPDAMDQDMMPDADFPILIKSPDHDILISSCQYGVMLGIVHYDTIAKIESKPKGNKLEASKSKESKSECKIDLNENPLNENAVDENKSNMNMVTKITSTVYCGVACPPSGFRSFLGWKSGMENGRGSNAKFKYPSGIVICLGNKMAQVETERKLVVHLDTLDNMHKLPSVIINIIAQLASGKSAYLLVSDKHNNRLCHVTLPLKYR